MEPLTPAQLQLHNQAVNLTRQHREVEWRVIEVLLQIEEQKLFKKFEHNSLFQYSVCELGLSESVTNCFISVARCEREFSPLQKALQEQTLSVSVTQRIVSAVNRENVHELVEFAKTHSAREINREVARIHQKAGREKMVTIQISLNTYENLKRAGSLRAQKGQTEKLEQTVTAVVDDYLERHDPVLKAERLALRNAQDCNAQDCNAPDRDAKTGSSKPMKQKELWTSRVSPKASGYPRRTPLTAGQKHAVNRRDRGRCTFRDTQARRCENERYLAIHHVHPVSLGGSNDPENLTTLCWHHHDLVHQQALPIEGQTSWLRSPKVVYRVQ